MFLPRLQASYYRYIARPILFLFDSEFDHDLMTNMGEKSENMGWLVHGLYGYNHPSLHKKVLGIDFENPIGLAAGFDYDGHMAKLMKHIGFGFNTVGSVTALPYEGNPKPRLGRLVKSKALLVNKGFKSGGAMAIRSRLDQKQLVGHTVGISVGSSNVPTINSISKAVADYVTTFKLFQNRQYVKYFELNISCPNISLREAFNDPINCSKLCLAINKLKLKQPLFVKMPNEISLKDSDSLVQVALNHDIRGFIFSNLVKDRTNPAFDRDEIASIAHLHGNFSGKPTFEGSLKLIRHTRKKFGPDIAIIGTGGVFSTVDAKAKFAAGADLIQLISALIFEGPQIVGQINHDLAKH